MCRWLLPALLAALLLTALWCSATTVAAASPVPDNVFAQALDLSQEIGSRTERLEHFLFNPAVTSPEIEALRKKCDALDLHLSLKLDDEARAKLQSEQTQARAKLRELVFAHPTVQKAIADLEASKAKLQQLMQQIKTIRAEQAKVPQTGAAP